MMNKLVQKANPGRLVFKSKLKLKVPLKIQNEKLFQKAPGDPFQLENIIKMYSTVKELIVFRKLMQHYRRSEIQNVCCCWIVNSVENCLFALRRKSIDGTRS